MKALYQKCGKVGAGRDAVTLCMIRNFSAAVSIRDPDRKAPISTRASMRQTKTKTEMKIETQNWGTIFSESFRNSSNRTFPECHDTRNALFFIFCIGYLLFKILAIVHELHVCHHYHLEDK